MKQWLAAGIIVVLTVLYIWPSSAQAYSYGDANTEDIAETFKLIETSVGNGANGWSAAEEAYKVRRSEIVSHFGEEVAVTLDANFKAKDNKLVVANFKGVLVMNLDRRFNYATNALNDYAEAKLLLAKAKATFDTLAPYVGKDSADLNKAFDAALDALGNPGLFGVGKKAVQPEVFKEKVGFIYDKVKPLFPYKATSASEPTPTAAPPVTAPQETPKAEVPAVVKPEPQATAGKPEDAKPVTTSQPAVTAAPTPAGEVKASETPAATASASPSATPGATVSPTSMPAATSKPAEASGASQNAVKDAAAHAPMERSNKTNPFVSVGVIGGVIVVAGAGFWLARKKKWI